jgi:hypothetical protein
MSRVRLLLPCLIVFCACTVDSGGEYVCQNKAPVTNAAGGLHGAACKENGECKYGVCSTSALMLAGVTGLKVCTKGSACGPGSQCSDDNDSAKGLEFTSIKAEAGAGSECGLACTSAADCTKYNPDLKFCVFSVKGYFSAGARKVCAAKQ